MKFTHLLLVILVAVLASVATVKYVAPTGGAVAEKKETAYERVMRTGVLRCGYFPWAPFHNTDPNSGRHTGIFPTYMEAVTNKLGLKLEWTKEVGDEEAITGLQYNQFDAYCSVFWPTANRAKAGALFINPIFYLQAVIVARAGDNRFNDAGVNLNDPAIKFTAMDGDAMAEATANAFPLTQRVTLPQLATVAELFETVVSGKSDLLVIDPLTLASYQKSNWNKVKKLEGRTALFHAPNSIAVYVGETELANMLNVTTNQLLANGTIEALLRSADNDYPNTFLRAQEGYRK